MGRYSGRLKNVLITGIILCCVTFFWIIGIAKDDGSYMGGVLDDRYLEIQDRLRRSELINKQRMNDLQLLRSQFADLVAIMSQNNTNNSTSGNIPTLMKENQSNLTEQIGSLHLPSIFTYLPHLTGNPNSMKPVYKLSKNRYGMSIVIGIPTIRREGADYLTETVKSLVEGMNDEEKAMCLIVVFVAEPWDQPYAETVGDKIQKAFPEAVESGLVEVISPPPEFYPDLENLKLTFGDTKERVKWRTKQNLDFSFLMLYARPRGFYYVQLEDDVIAKPGFLSIMKVYADQQKEVDWVLLEFSALGFIGKLFKSSQLPVIVEFFLMFHRDKPIDWLLDHFLSVKVCSPEKDAKHCLRMVAEVRKRFKPSLFQHVGTHSSLKGKTQKLKDKDFGRQPIYRAHVNPPASVHSTLKAYQKYLLKKAYIGEDIFWGLAPIEGDIIEIRFDPPLMIERYLLRSGNSNHPADLFSDTIVEVLEKDADSDSFQKVGEFDENGLAAGTLGENFGKISILRMKCLKTLNNWVILSEIHIVPKSIDSKKTR